jgi:hypothetical protein
MSYRVTINGFPVECDSRAELYAITGQPDGHRAHPKGPPGDAEPEGDKRRKEHAKRTLAWLSAVKSGPEIGITGRQVGDAVGVENLSGLATYRFQAEKLLRSLSFAFSDVMTQTRVEDVRRWAAGGRIDEAIKALKELAKS